MKKPATTTAPAKPWKPQRYKLVHPDQARALRSNMTLEVAHSEKNVRWNKHIRKLDGAPFRLFIVPMDWSLQGGKWAPPAMALSTPSNS